MKAPVYRTRWSNTLIVCLQVLIALLPPLVSTKHIPVTKEVECGIQVGVDGCSAESCTNHDDCPRDHVCCYNGCKRTCLPPVPPAPAFDWTEETPFNLRPLKGNQYGSGTKQEQTMRAETVVLQGGCLITKEQMVRLEDFSNNTHVQRCFCDEGGIYCQIID